jgi:hypothetical protein
MVVSEKTFLRSVNNVQLMQSCDKMPMLLVRQAKMHASWNCPETAMIYTPFAGLHFATRGSQKCVVTHLVVLTFKSNRKVRTSLNSIAHDSGWKFAYFCNLKNVLLFIMAAILDFESRQPKIISADDLYAIHYKIIILICIYIQNKLDEQNLHYSLSCNCSLNLSSFWLKRKF